MQKQGVVEVYAYSDDCLYFSGSVSEILRNKYDEIEDKYLDELETADIAGYESLSGGPSQFVIEESGVDDPKGLVLTVEFGAAGSPGWSMGVSFLQKAPSGLPHLFPKVEMLAATDSDPTFKSSSRDAGA